jgi:hypothetical protein
MSVSRQTSFPQVYNSHTSLQQYSQLMHTTKRLKFPDGDGNDDVFSQNSSGDDVADDISASGSQTEGTSDTEEIALSNRTRSKKTLKRKRRATEPSHFGATLQSLLNTDAPSTLPLSLKPSVTRQKHDKLELKANKLSRIEKREKDDNRRIRDAIGGWGGESERGLRKVAQRGGTTHFTSQYYSYHSCSGQVVQCYPAVANRCFYYHGKNENCTRRRQTFVACTHSERECQRGKQEFN